MVYSNNKCEINQVKYKNECDWKTSENTFYKSPFLLF